MSVCAQQVSGTARPKAIKCAIIAIAMRRRRREGEGKSSKERKAGAVGVDARAANEDVTQVCSPAPPCIVHNGSDRHRCRVAGGTMLQRDKKDENPPRKFRGCALGIQYVVYICSLPFPSIALRCSGGRGHIKTRMARRPPTMTTQTQSPPPQAQSWQRREQLRGGPSDRQPA